MNFNVEKELFNIQDKKYQEFQKKLCPGIENIIGIRVPVLRNYAKELLNKYNFKEIMEAL